MPAPRQEDESPMAAGTDDGAPPRLDGAPVLGSAYRLFRDPRALIVAASRALGPVFRIGAVGRHFTVIAGDAARTLMAEDLDQQVLTRHPLFDPLEREFGGGDFTMAHAGPRHTRLRVPLAIAFSRQAASPFVAPLVALVRDIALDWPEGRRVGVSEQTARLAFAQWRLLLGPAAAGLRYRDCRRLASHWMLTGAGILPSWILQAPWLRASHRRAFAVFRRVVAEARASATDAAAAPSIVQALVSARDRSGRPLTDAEAVTYVAYGTLAASAYVARLAAFMTWEIARDAALGEQLSTEVADAFRRGVDDAADLRRLPVLQSVYHETLRRHTVSPGMPFVAACSFQYGGARIPQGETVLLSPVPLAADPAAFPDPDRFEPARCREPRHEHRRGNGHPFGLGDRTCVAIGLVEVMAVTLVAALVDTRAFALARPGARLSMRAVPLPAPSPRCRLRVGERRAPTAAGAEPRVPTEEERLATFGGQDAPAVRAALARAELRTFPPGSVIVREGDPADAYYVLQSGAVEVTQGPANRRVAALGPGDGFGELGLLRNAPRAATVSAGPAGASALVLHREAFLEMVAASDLVATDIRALMHRRIAENRLRQLAPGLTPDLAKALLPDFELVVGAPGEAIVTQGDVADHFFVLVEGRVTVSQRGPDGQQQALATLGPGEYFGETGLLRGAPRNATVAATADGPVTLLRTDAAGFNRLLQDTGEAGADLARAMLARADRLEAR